MSSEGDYYHDRYDYRYDRRSSRKPYRRGSSPRRRRRFDSDCFNRKNQRTKGIHKQLAPRLAGFILLLVIVVYEVLVLNGAAKTTAPTQSDTTQISKSRHLWTPLPPPPAVVVDVLPESHQKEPTALSSPNSSDSRPTGNGSQSSTPTLDKPSTVTSLENKPPTPVTSEGASDSASADAKATTSSATNSIPTESKTNSLHLPERAIRMEAKGADEDPDIDPGSVGKPGSSHTTSDSSASSSTGDQAALPKTTNAGDKGADPGAGENFWNWFQETKGSEKSNVSKDLPCPEEYERLCRMFYKYIRKYKIRRIFDVSCEKNFEWVGGVLKKVGNELWGFKYYCSIWEGQRAEDARKRLQGLPFVQFDEAQWWRAGFPPDTELLFAWDTLAHLAYGRVWNFFVKARKQDIKYILVDNYPGILNDPSPKRDYLNLRKHPFRFPAAQEVAQNVTEPGETAKRQLLFYETSMLPDNLQ